MLVVGFASAGLLVASLSACGGSSKPTAIYVSPSVIATAASSAPTTPDSTATPTPTVTPKHTSKPKPKPPVKAAIPDQSTVTIGKDVPAGTYETLHATTDCYWEIDTHATGTMVDSSLGKGGHLTVTLKDGQDFSTQYCGDWKQK